MAREIKFRGWNKAEKVMVDLQKITPLALEPMMNTQLSMKGHGGLFLPFMDELILMQYTGRQACTDELDADGIHQQKQDLYGGDIIRHEITDMDLPSDYEPLFETHAVRYSDADAAWRCGPYSLQSVLAGPHRLIGNVHESPQLLESKT